MLPIIPLLLGLGDAPLHPVDSSIEAVVVYPSAARVTRHATVELPAGPARIRLQGLGSAADGSNARAFVQGASLVAMEHGVDSIADPQSSVQAAELDAAIVAKTDEIALLKGRAATIEVEVKLVDAVSVRAGTDATRDGGTAALDLSALDKQAEWIRSRRFELARQAQENLRNTEKAQRELGSLVANRQRLGGSRADSWIDLIVDVPTAGTVECRAEIPMSNAGWHPFYSVRGDPITDEALIEYEANITQSTGEDWKSVSVTLSTAEVTGEMAPPEIEPWFVDVYVPRPASPAGGGGAGLRAVDAAMPAPGAPVEMDRFRKDKSLVEKGKPGGLFDAATVEATGPAVAFVMPVPISVPSDSSGHTRARIGEVTAAAKYLRQAQPLVDEDVYLRSTLTNSSEFQLLPGPVSLFMGGEFVGSTEFEDTIPPGQQFDLFLGPDRSVHAERELVLKTDGQSGLFGGGRDIHYDYRIRIVNSNPVPVAVELLDRQPVSRNDRIEIKSSKVTPALSTDKKYLEDLAPTGILRWDLSIPPTKAGEAGFAVTWSVDVTHSREVFITPLPE